MRSTVLRKILTAAVAVGLLLAFERSARRARAAWLVSQYEREPIERACQAEPGNAFCFALLADAVDQQGGDGAPWRRRALELAPRKATYLVAAATATEMSGDPSAALRLLEQADRYNKMWLPRWALANFHLRQGDNQESLRWARLAIERSYGDRAAVFDLAAKAGAGPASIVGKLLPEGASYAAAYLDYVLKNPKRPGLAEAASAASRHARSAPPALRAQLLEASNRLILAGDFPAAAGLWDDLARQQAIPYPPRDQAGINGDFRRKPLPGGWDWWMPVVEGVESSWRTDPGEVRFTLSGQQAESCELLGQWLWLAGGAVHELAIESHGGVPGVAWRLMRADGTLAGTLEPTPGDGWRESRLAIPAATEARALRLVLVSHRIAGHPRPQGEYRVRKAACVRG